MQTCDETTRSSHVGYGRPGEGGLKEGLRWHDFYVDPTNDVVLRSTDGVLFRASSYVLKRESSFFYDMLSSIPNPHMSPTDAIPLEWRAETISVFLDAASTLSPLDYSDSNPIALCRLLKLVQYLDCDRLITSISIIFEQHCHQNPTSWLIAMSDHNDLAGAKAALAVCRDAQSGSADPEFLFRGLIGMVRVEWRSALMRALTDGPLVANNGDRGVRIRWPSGVRLAQFERYVEEDRAELSDSLMKGEKEASVEHQWSAR